FWQQIIDSGVIDHLLSLPPPRGLEPAAKQTVAGYVAGYNRYLADVGGSRGVRDPTCRGKPWVRPITTADAYRRFYQLIELASGDVVIPGIAEAQAPTPAITLPPTPIGLPPLPLVSPQATAKALAARLSMRDAGS